MDGGGEVSPAQQVAWIRDVPVSCVCEQVWRNGRWVRSVPHPGCPWHGQPVQTVGGVS